SIGSRTSAWSPERYTGPASRRYRSSSVMPLVAAVPCPVPPMPTPRPLRLGPIIARWRLPSLAKARQDSPLREPPGQPLEEPLDRGSGEQCQTDELDDADEAPPGSLPLSVDHGRESGFLLPWHASGLDDDPAHHERPQEDASPRRIELGDHVATEHEYKDAGHLQYFPRGCGSFSRVLMTQFVPFHGRTIGACRTPSC